jgi:predicted branched-subunit amino acid permease
MKRTSSVQWSSVLRGMLDAVALPAWIVGVSTIGIGSLAQDVGHPPGAVILSTLLMWAGPAQVALYGGLAVGASLPAIALAASLSSIRFLPMTVSLLPLLRRPGQRTSVQILAAHYVTVTVWVESLRRLPSVPGEHRMSYYFGFANAMLGISCALTLLGYYLAGALSVPFQAALLFLTPAFFTISLSASARNAAQWSAVILGFLLVPFFTAIIGGDFDLIAVGLVGGSCAYLVDRRLRASLP